MAVLLSAGLLVERQQVSRRQTTEVNSTSTRLCPTTPSGLRRGCTQAATGS